MSAPILRHLLLTLAAFLLYTGIYLTLSSRRLFRRTGERAAPGGTGFDPVNYARWLVIPMFLSLLFYYVPLARGDEAHTGFLSALFDAVVRSLQTFSLDASVRDAWDAAETQDIVYARGDRVWLSFFLMTAPVLTLASAATLFRTPRLWYIMLFSRRRICVFSDLNERAVIYAEVLQKRPETGSEEQSGGRRVRPPHIVFCANDQPEDTDTSGLPGPALVLRQDICELFLFPWAARRTSFYLITENENTILEQAERLHREYSRFSSRIYCVSTGNLNELAVDWINRNVPSAGGKPGAPEKGAPAGEKPGEEALVFEDGRLTRESRKQADEIRSAHIEIINEPFRVVFRSLYDRDDPLLDAALLEKAALLPEREGLRKINVLILGAGAVGKVLARTMLWYCQLPGMGVRVTVVSQETEKRIRGTVLSKNPEFSALLTQLGYGDRAQLRAIGEKDLMSEDLEKLLQESHASPDAEYHLVFVSAGDDVRNLQLTMRARRHYLRHPNSFGCPKLCTVIWDEAMNDMAKQKGYFPLQGTDKQDYTPLRREPSRACGTYNRDCRVRLMGSMTDTIRPGWQLTFDALRCHAFYSHGPTGQADDPSILRLCGPRAEIPVEDYRSYYGNSESDERSNWAAAVHGIVKYTWYTLTRRSSPAGRAEPVPSGGEALPEPVPGLARALVETEQIRWCIFKLTEGDCPVPESGLEEYLKNVAKGRDADQIRGFHAALRTWQDLEDKAARSPGGKWTGYVNSTIGIVYLTLRIEEAWAQKKGKHGEGA